MSDRYPEPKLMDAAFVALSKLDWLKRKRLHRQLRRLANGEIDPRNISVLSSPRREPPWQEFFVAEVHVVFRRLTEAERGYDPSSALFIVASIVPPEGFEDAMRDLSSIE